MTGELCVAVLSDVHGNLQALQAVLADIKARGAFDRIVTAGDHCLNGPDPGESLELILARSTDVLKGNTDRDLVDEGQSDPELGAKKRASIAWTRDTLGSDRIDVLDALPFSVRVTAPDGSTLQVVHANPLDLDRHIFPDIQDAELEQLVNAVDADVLVYGHLHIPFRQRFANLRLFNIASCGAPRDGDRRAVWGEFVWSRKQGWRGVIHRTPYDLGDAVLRIIDSGMPHPDKRIRDLLRATYE